MPSEAGGLAAPARALFNTLVGLMGGRGQAVSSGPSDAAIRATLDYLHQRAASATTVPVIEPDAVRPLMEVIWAPLLGALSTLYDEYNDPKLVTVCMGGVAAAACLSAQVGACTHHVASSIDVGWLSLLFWCLHGCGSGGPCYRQQPRSSPRSLC